MSKRLIFFFVLLLKGVFLFALDKSPQIPLLSILGKSEEITFLYPGIIRSLYEGDEDSTFYLYEYRTCKSPNPFLLNIPPAIPPRATAVSNEKERSHFFTATGEISFQHFDRKSSANNLLLINSSSDIVSARLNLLFQEKYPFSFSIRYNQSRPFQLDNQYEINFGFDDRQYKELVRKTLIQETEIRQLQEARQLTDRYQRNYNLFQQQKMVLDDPSYIQSAIENSVPYIRDEKPQILDPAIPSFNNKFGQQRDQLLTGAPGYQNAQLEIRRLKDSIVNAVEQARKSDLRQKTHDELLRKRDSLASRVKDYNDSLDQQKAYFKHQLDSINRHINSLYSAADLKQLADQRKVNDSTMKRRWPEILMKTHLRLGKFLLNQSELTINNIFLHGISIQYGDERFVQVSGGFYDFAFRQVFNFRGDSINRKLPSLLSVRIGKTDGRNLSAYTFYVGRKTRTGGLNTNFRTVAGVSYEQKIYFNRNLSLNVEVAKSTTRPSNFGNKNEQVFKDLFTSFSTKTIGVYGEMRVSLPKTKTDAEVSYKYWGRQFESFNASQYFNPQNNLAAKLTQPLFKRKLYLSSGIRYTDFSTFGIASNMKTKTLFASATAMLRLKKAPIISVGYYPGSQLYWLENSKLYEYYYYILNSTLSHHFSVGKVPFQAVLTWNKFYNRYTDSVVAGSQSYQNVFLTAWKGNFSYTTNYSRQQIENSSLHTIEAGMNYSTTKLKAGGSIKENFMRGYSELGYSLSFGLVVKRMGSINLIYDRSFLPGRSSHFVPVTTGQVQIIKPLKFTL